MVVLVLLLVLDAPGQLDEDEARVFVFCRTSGPSQFHNEASSPRPSPPEEERE
jgi:hypothetical protein